MVLRGKQRHIDIFWIAEHFIQLFPPHLPRHFKVLLFLWRWNRKTKCLIPASPTLPTPKSPYGSLRLHHLFRPCLREFVSTGARRHKEEGVARRTNPPSGCGWHSEDNEAFSRPFHHIRALLCLRPGEFASPHPKIRHLFKFGVLAQIPSCIRHEGMTNSASVETLDPPGHLFWRGRSHRPLNTR